MKILLSLICLFYSCLALSDGGLTVYTSRKTHLIQPLFEAYTKKTGVKIQHINGKAGALIQKIKQEGSKTPADLLITVDAGNLWNAAQLGLLAGVSSKALATRVPTQLRDKKNQWFALSLRARTIFYNNKKLKASDIKSYQDLADPQWKGKLCLRTSRKVYNQSLVASLLERLGKDSTEKVVKGWVANLAKPVFTNDTQLLEAINKGGCQIGIANTYYMARLLKKNKAKDVSVFWPSGKEGGVHVNVSGGAVVKESKNKKKAIEFLEWLTTNEAQEIFAGLNDEYPVVQGVKISSILKKWGNFDRDPTPLHSIGPNQKKAVMIMDKAQYR